MLLDLLDDWVGGLAGKQVLDLGGGPGHYTLEFAKRGARVTWFDVSSRYQELARSKCAEAGVRVEFAVGYLDEAASVLQRSYDLVFNRLCWYYSFNDATFARMVYGLCSAGGVIYVDTHHSQSRRAAGSVSIRLRTALNDLLGIKVGHPFPPKGRIPALFMRHPYRRMLVDYSSPDNERVLLQIP
jgi:2-polyprenyl-3-methyl-5-hydroxy-6-metoxy-1,4-benzoquinol methylase